MKVILTLEFKRHKHCVDEPALTYVDATNPGFLTWIPEVEDDDVDAVLKLRA